MGIRVHKFLGYGLDDVKCNHAEQPRDPRINNDSPLLTYQGDELDKYEKWLKGRYGDMEKVVKDDPAALRDIPLLDRWYFRDIAHPNSRRDKRSQITDCIAFDSEFGLENVLVLQPVACTDWERYDDMIDYTVESYLFDRPENYVTPRLDRLKHGLYPFNGSYMDSRDGRRLPDVVMDWVRTVSHVLTGVDAAEAVKYGPVLDDYAVELGFEDQPDAMKHIAPVVPGEILELAEYAELFTDPSVAWQLRPMLYTWWS